MDDGVDLTRYVVRAAPPQLLIDRVFGNAPGHICGDRAVGAHAYNGTGAHGTIGLAVPCAIKPVALRSRRGGIDRFHAADIGKGTLRAKPEPPRESWRLFPLRGLSYATNTQVFTRAA